MYSKKQILLSIIALLWLSLALAQDPQPAWRNYNTEHGLPSSEAYVAMQDSKGYMWFGTDNGLSRFDGYNFQNYGPVDGLQDNVVFDLQEDHQGRIWIMTMSGNAYYHFQDSIYPFQYNDTIQYFKEKMSSIMGVHLYFDNADSSLYVTLRNFGILQIRADGSNRLFRSNKPTAMVVLELKEKVLYAYSKMKDEFYFPYEEWLYENRLLAPMAFHRDSIINIFPEGNVFRSTPQTGMIKAFNDGNILFEYDRSFGIIRNDSIQWIREFDYDITSVFKDFYGDIFLCLNYGFGARKYKNIELPEKEEFITLLPGYSAVNMTQDSSNGFWFTTSEEGIFYTPEINLQTYDEGTGLSDKYVSIIEIKDDSTLFVGLRNGDIFELNAWSHKLLKLPSIKQNNVNYSLETLFYHNETNVLYAGSGLQWFNGNSWEMINLKPRSNRITTHPVKKIVASNENKHLWIISAHQLKKLDLATGTVRQIKDLVHSTKRIFTEYVDIEGQLWLGRIDGLWQLQGDTTLVRPEMMHPTFHHRIETIQQLPDSTFALGTKGKGIVLWKDSSFIEITASNGLSSNMIENIYVDKMGIIWVGTLMGLNRVTFNQDGTFSIKKITVAHGLPSNEINQVEVLNDEVWVATTKGLVRFPYEQQLNGVSDPPFFEAVLINDKAVDWKKTDLTFSYQQNNISFQFLTINYRQDGQIPYRYRLLPAQQSWKETQNRLVSYPALDNGDYSFEVQSRNEDGIWSDPTSFRFAILPAWWETWWAISLAFLSMFLVGFAIYKNRTRHLKNEITLQKQLTEVERQALRSQMNPHFIFNALNAIQGYIAQGDKLAANRYLSRFSKLIRSALQHSRVTKIPLEDDLNSLKNYIELEQLRFKGGFDYQINIADEIDPTEVTIPPMLVQPFVENAIIHGFTNLEGKGKINIDFYKKNGFLLITIRDNGIGIEASKKQIKSITSSHKSVGITITKRRLEMLSGNGEIGNVHTKELKDEYGQVIGTSVSLRIPLEE